MTKINTNFLIATGDARLMFGYPASLFAEQNLTIENRLVFGNVNIPNSQNQQTLEAVTSITERELIETEKKEYKDNEVAIQEFFPQAKGILQEHLKKEFTDTDTEVKRMTYSLWKEKQELKELAKEIEQEKPDAMEERKEIYPLSPEEVEKFEIEVINQAGKLLPKLLKMRPGDSILEYNTGATDVKLEGYPLKTLKVQFRCQIILEYEKHTWDIRVFKGLGRKNNTAHTAIVIENAKHNYSGDSYYSRDLSPTDIVENIAKRLKSTAEHYKKEWNS